MFSACAHAEIAAPITAVVLYPGSATVVRTAQVAAGTAQVVVTGLPANFDIQTLRAEADPGIRIGQIVTQDSARTDAANPAEAELEGKIKSLQDQKSVLEVQVKAAEIVTGYLERFGGNSTGDRPQAAIDAKTLAGLIDTIGRGANEALGRIQRVAVQKREIDEKIQALQRDLARLRSSGKDMRSVTVNLNADRAGLLRISYQLNNAGWKPAYLAKLDSASSRVELERMAAVSQKTGEAWTNVTLTLSTSQPRQSPQAPEPQPWLLAYHPPRPAPSSPEPRPGIMAAPAPAALAKEARGGNIADSYTPPTFETQSAFATEFEVPGRVSLPADGREVSLALAKQTLPVIQRLRVAPRISKSATVTAEAERPAGVWLAGNVQLFRDGNYVGATLWNPQASGRFVFSFGRDELLRVTVDQVKGDSGSTGVFDRRNERRIAEVFNLTSAHKTPIEVVILESSPVSTSEEIKVQASFEPKPATDAWEQRRGVVAWEKTFAPNESARFRVEYSIEYPKEGSVSGLR
jgi:uncharacterized protein (TIGR02231 family)